MSLPYPSLAIVQDAVLSSAMPARLRAVLAVFLIVGVAWALSTDRSKVSWRVVAWGLGLPAEGAGGGRRAPRG
jgi:hypothetical protein